MAETRNSRKHFKKNHQNQKNQPQKTKKPPYWAVVRRLVSCKYLQTGEQQQPQPMERNNDKRCKKIGFSGSLCNNTRVVHRPEASPHEDYKKWGSMGSCNTNGSLSSPLSLLSSGSSIGGSFGGMHLRRLSGCYECRTVVDLAHGVSRDPSMRATVCSCPECGEIFTKPENLVLHQSMIHAVSELGPEDTSRNIVEIIFQSSWLKKQTPICKIDRILKVNNSQKTITRFENYRESIKGKANKLANKHPRCVADGNELLRFHCTTFICSLGMNGSSNLCNSIPQCNICSIIRDGFKIDGIIGGGICTTATSGKAHDNAQITLEDDKRAMLVCRVIAGTVKKNRDTDVEEFDSVAGHTEIYSNLDELFVFNPKAILPCFVVIYSGF